MSETKGPYVIEFGDIWFRRTAQGHNAAGHRSDIDIGKTHICGPSEMMAVAFDKEDGILHKHGPEERVTAWLKDTRAKFSAAGFDALGDALTIVSFLPVPEAIEELNACIAISGRVLRFEESLEAILAGNPAYGDLPRYPR